MQLYIIFTAQQRLQQQRQLQMQQMQQQQQQQQQPGLNNQQQQQLTQLLMQQVEVWGGLTVQHKYWLKLWIESSFLSPNISWELFDTKKYFFFLDIFLLNSFLLLLEEFFKHPLQPLKLQNDIPRF